MRDTHFSAILLPLVGTVCLVIALFYLYKKPQVPKSTPPRPHWSHLLIRWGPTVFWFFLAMASFLGAGWLGGNPGLATQLCAVTLLLYLLGMIVVLIAELSGN